MSISDNRRVKQPSSSSGVYLRLDPAAIAALHQPPAPSVYASLSIRNASGHYDYPDVHQLSINDNSTGEQPASSSGAYEGLDPAAIAVLRQPPAPTVYASLSQDTAGASQVVHDTESEGEHPENYEGLDLTSFNVLPLPHDYAGISGTTRASGSAARNYLELIYSPQDNDDD